MNKRALEKFAPRERVNLRNAVEKRLQRLGLNAPTLPDFSSWFNQTGSTITVNGQVYLDYDKQVFQALYQERVKVGYEQLVEEVAYTWFNRLIAIRYMEVKGLLPDYVKILEQDELTRRPEIMSNYGHLSVNRTEIEDLKLRNEEEAAYRKLFLASANKLGEIMPFLFEPLQDWTELVLPEKMLEPSGIIERILTAEGLAESFEDGVEAIGWLYQFYMSERKKLVGGLNKAAIKKEDLSVVTQLFTPRWIVDYMVENTLGKLYDEWQPENDLAKDWVYYLKHQESKKMIPEFEEQLENIKFFDPACGSGHILVVAFEHFYKMYLEQGYRRSEIGSLILQHNLYGAEIDRRAVQITNFVLFMKAAEYDSRFLSRVKIENTHIIELTDSIDLTNEEWEWLTPNSEERSKLQYVVSSFEHAKQFGSLIQPIEFNYTGWIQKLESMKVELVTDIYESSIQQSIVEKLLPILYQAKLLADQYQVVVTNPPYHNNFNPMLKAYMQKNYPDFKSDLYSAFISRSLTLSLSNGYVGMMTPYTWMFISSHQKMREHIVDYYSFSSLVQLEYSAFEEATVPICTFVIQKQNQNPIGEYIRLSELKGDQSEYVKYSIENPDVNYRYRINSGLFKEIIGSPIAYWIHGSITEAFKESHLLNEQVALRAGMQTGDNEKFLRYWNEISFEKLGIGFTNGIQTMNSNKKWFPYNKGGGYRKWYGNRFLVVDWENDGTNIKKDKLERLSKGLIEKKNSQCWNEEFYFKEGLTWSALSSGDLSVRYSPVGSIFDTKGASLFITNISSVDLLYVLALLNSNLAKEFMKIFSPTLDFGSGAISKIPLKVPDQETQRKVCELVQENVDIAKKDWDMTENSWEFNKPTFLKFREESSLLENAYLKWEEECMNQVECMKRNEEEINRILNSIYNVNDFVSSEIKHSEIELLRANRKRDCKSFLSYFIGCLVGRYSIDHEGLVFAGGKWDRSVYRSFQPAEDGIISLTDEHILKNSQDIYLRLKDFLVNIFGVQTLEENLKWIAEQLKEKANETVEQTIRNYFLKDFIKDHIQVYKKRPIYWLISSGKQKGMQSLIYMHRYTPNTFGLAMQNHFIPLLSQWRSLAQVMQEELDSGSLSPAVKREKNKQLRLYQQRVVELEVFQDKLDSYARQQIPINLDDGVKVNYQKFNGILTKIDF